MLGMKLDTKTAAARVCLTLCAYFGLARKVTSVGEACSIPATPVISTLPSPSSVQPSAEARSESFITLGYLAQTSGVALDRDPILSAAAHRRALAGSEVGGEEDFVT